MKQIAIIFAAVVLLCGSTYGQTTQPSKSTESAWTDAVTEFVAALGGGDIAAIEPKLASSATIRSFDSDAPRNIAEMLAFSGECSQMGAHAYFQLPSALAADIAGDFKDAGDVDETLRNRMVPDEKTLIRANATATQWLTRVLSPHKDQPIGVIVFRSTASDKADVNSTTSCASFILLKGELTSQGYRIKQIVFGNPLATVR